MRKSSPVGRVTWLVAAIFATALSCGDNNTIGDPSAGGTVPPAEPGRSSPWNTVTGKRSNGTPVLTIADSGTYVVARPSPTPAASGTISTDELRALRPVADAAALQDLAGAQVCIQTLVPLPDFTDAVIGVTLRDGTPRTLLDAEGSNGVCYLGDQGRANDLAREIAKLYLKYAADPTPEPSPTPPVCTQIYVYGLNVRVLDTLDSTAIMGATLTLTEGTYTETMEARPEGYYVGAGERAGTYLLNAAAPGHLPKILDNIRVDADTCHVIPQTFEIKLDRTS